MGPLKILIVEDELLVAKPLQILLEELGYMVTGIFNNAKSALAEMELNPPDLALLDIQLKSEETGIWLAEQINKNFDLPYIFLTSFDDPETISKATETSPFGYLIKPIKKQHLFAAIGVAMKKYADLVSVEGNDHKEIILQDALFVRDEYLLVKIEFKDISFVRPSGNYLEIHTPNKKYLIKGTMSSFSKSLPEQQFLQTHRSYILNVSKVEALGKNFVKIGEVRIPITPQKKDVLLERIQLYQKD
ncbi:MAG: response regulator [Cyclobacteriaceae bacterium]